MNTSNELRSRLPLLAGEMYEQIAVALERIRIEAANQPTAPAAWIKGMNDALVLLRGCALAQEQFRRWAEEVVHQEPDECGLTRQERAVMFGGEKKCGTRNAEC